MPVRLNNSEKEIILSRNERTIGQILLENGGFVPDWLRDQIGKLYYIAIADYGVKTLPDKLQELRIFQIITTRYRIFTVTDLRLAFELPLVEEYEANTNHFNSFDTKFVTGLLNAYKRNKIAVNKKVQFVGNNSHKQPYTAKEIEQFRKEYVYTICDKYKEYCTSGSVYFVRFDRVYNDLMDWGLIEVTNYQWLCFVEQAKLIYKTEQIALKNEKNPFRRTVQEIPNATGDDKLFKIRSIIKRIAIFHFFEQWKVAKLDIGTYLKDQFNNKLIDSE